METPVLNGAGTQPRLLLGRGSVAQKWQELWNISAEEFISNNFFAIGFPWIQAVVEHRCASKGTRIEKYVRGAVS